MIKKQIKRQKVAKSKIDLIYYHPFKHWLIAQKLAIVDALVRFIKNPLSCILTVLVMAISFSLPVALFLLLQNVEKFSGTIEDASQITVYLNPNVDLLHSNDLSDQILAMPEVAKITVIDKDKALQQLQQLSGFSNILQQLPDNPLPTSLVITPKANDVIKLQELQERIANLPYVDEVQIDLLWIERLNTFLEIAQNTVLILGSLLLIAALLISSNTIKLHIETRQTEIEIMSLIGATDTHIKRPFIYLGGLYGLLAGFLAYGIIYYSFEQLGHAVMKLAGLYASDFTLDNLPTIQACYLVLVATLLGSSAAYFATYHHLSKLKLK